MRCTRVFAIITAILLCMLSLAAPVQADMSKEPLVPEDLLHEAVMSLTQGDYPFVECWTEGHVILGEEDFGETIEVYAFVETNGFGFLGGMFTGQSMMSIPAKIVFDRTETGLAFRELEEPLDGEGYVDSVKAMIPERYYRSSTDDDTAELFRQQESQARAYLDSIGRMECIVHGVGDANLKLNNILVPASNLLLSFSQHGFPMYVAEEERIENGVRYIYTHTWTPADPNTVEAGTDYITPEGLYYHDSGVPGTERLTKKRYDDDITIETVDIMAELYDLYVTLMDSDGYKQYYFVFDGWSYHQPTITLIGECHLSYDAFDRYCSWLPE